MERKDAIEYLQALKKCELCEEISTEICKHCENRRKGSSPICYDALDFAIASLKADEAYQLEHENRDVVEVVRCQDCKRWQLLSNSSIHYCTLTHRFSGSKEFCNLGISYNKEKIDEQRN